MQTLPPWYATICSCNRPQHDNEGVEKLRKYVVAARAFQTIRSATPNYFHILGAYQ